MPDVPRKGFDVSQPGHAVYMVFVVLGHDSRPSDTAWMDADRVFSGIVHVQASVECSQEPRAA